MEKSTGTYPGIIQLMHNKKLWLPGLLLITLMACKKLEPASVSSGFAEGESAAVKKWKDDKLSLFIHFGLYSWYGGMYQGQAVTKGYSEQIMAHAPIDPAEYQASAANFNPSLWNADSMVNLAIRGGLKSIVITAKHHDGFNMYDTRYSDFSITKASPFKRDIVKELADACHSSGLGFGVYYSLIDWNTKEGATPISSHNADSISPALHQLNIHQITELCENYGTLSEIWFDMGSLTLEQSKEIRNVVKKLQPDCMISGRLGNGQGDFMVLGDNEISENKMSLPWQTPASIYDETWGYRSWQSQVDVRTKLNEHLNRITQVVSKGGNYLINIGPKGDGSVVDFEKQVIQGIGQWLSQNGEAIYGTRPFPVGEKPWGVFTYSPSNIFMHLTRVPDEGEIILYGLNNKISSVSTLNPPYSPINYTHLGPTTTIDLGMTPIIFEPTTILRLQFIGDLDLTPGKLTYSDGTGKYHLNVQNANTTWALDGANYYSMVPSMTSISWDIANPKDLPYEIILFYTQEEKNKTIQLNINGHTETLDLSKYKTFRQVTEEKGVIPSTINTQGPYQGLSMTSHPGAIGYTTPGEPWGAAGRRWSEVPFAEDGKYLNLNPGPMGSYYYLFNVMSSMETKWITAFGTDDAFMIWLNGKYLYSTGYPSPPDHVHFIELPLNQESNTLIVKNLNTTGEFKSFFSFKVDQIRFEKEAGFTKLIPQKINHLAITLAQAQSPFQNLGTPNLRIVIQEKKK